jgi:NADH-quinone oxidoreductase subunit J
MIQQIVFYSFAALLIFSALMVITVRNPVHAALFLVLSFFSSAAVWLLMHAEFLAIALVLVYVGAVMVLFLFVVMMLDINLAPLREGFARYLPIGIIMALLMMLAMGLALTREKIGIAPPAAEKLMQGVGNTTLLGQSLYTNFLYPFEIAGAILLVAIIAAISLTMRKGKDVRTPKPELQVTVRRDERVRLVGMKSEKADE